MQEITGCRVTMKKAPIHAPGDGFQPMRSWVLCSLGTKEAELVKSQSELYVERTDTELLQNL